MAGNSIGHDSFGEGASIERHNGSFCDKTDGNKNHVHGICT